MLFDMPGNRTVDVKRVSTVSIVTSGAEKQHFLMVKEYVAQETRCTAKWTVHACVGYISCTFIGLYKK